jgi:hypothetical protein
MLSEKEAQLGRMFPRDAQRGRQVAQRREIEASIFSPFPVDNLHFSKVYFLLVSKPSVGLLTSKKG